MSRSATLFEYVVDGDHRSPDCTTVAVSADMLEEAVGYYVESLDADTLSDTLSDYMYEDAYKRIADGRPDSVPEFIVDMVRDYVKDTA